jgi:serralysin
MSDFKLPRLCLDKIIKNNGDPYELQKDSHIGTTVPSKCWSIGQTLSIRFLNGDPIVQTKIKEIAKNWINYANLKFDFIYDGDAHIRIGFQNNGSWSYIGTDAKDIPQDKPTMNFSWLKTDTEDREYEYYIVLHEFGHALGLIHENQNPEGQIPWNKEVVYNYFSSAPYYWNREMVDHEIFQRYSRSYSNGPIFDPYSIMTYNIPREFLLGGYHGIQGPSYLSSYDQEGIRKMYPHTINKDDKQPIMQSDDPLRILKQRFAKGEINKDEFLEMRRILES